MISKITVADELAFQALPVETKRLFALMTRELESEIDELNSIIISLEDEIDELKNNLVLSALVVRMV